MNDENALRVLDPVLASAGDRLASGVRVTSSLGSSGRSAGSLMSSGTGTGSLMSSVSHEGIVDMRSSVGGLNGRIGSEGLVRFAGYACTDGFSAIHFGVSTVTGEVSERLRAQRGAWFSEKLLTALEHLGVEGLLSLLSSGAGDVTVTSVCLKSYVTDGVLSVNRYGLVASQVPNEASRLMARAHRELPGLKWAPSQSVRD